MVILLLGGMADFSQAKGSQPISEMSVANNGPRLAGG